MNETQRRNQQSQKRKRQNKKMEDFVAEAESLLRPINPRENGDEVVEETQNPEPEAAKQEEERATGFVNYLISSLVTGGDAAEEEEEENPPKQAEKETSTAGGKSEEKGGRVLDQIISSLVIPLSPKTSTKGKVEVFDATSETESGFRGSEEELGGGGGGGGGGGFINNILSNLFHHSESEGEVGESREGSKNNEKLKVGEENKAEKTGEDEGGGGIIDNIVSHLPSSVPDGAAPTSDEATILIHIVQD